MKPHEAQLHLPFETADEFTRGGKLVRTASFSVEEGIRQISVMKTASQRLKMFLRGDTTCVKCGVKGSIFYMEKQANDKLAEPHLRLYGVTSEGNEVMMTWDHILPRSMGGGNDLKNAQCMCSKCNEEKGNNLSLSELVFIATHKDIISMTPSVQKINFREQCKGRLQHTVNTVNAESKRFFVQVYNIRRKMGLRLQ